MGEERKQLPVPDLKARKKAEEKVVMVSVPDYPARYGRSGRASTLPPSATRSA
jgi:hypothetical protein